MLSQAQVQNRTGRYYSQLLVIDPFCDLAAFRDDQVRLALLGSLEDQHGNGLPILVKT